MKLQELVLGERHRIDGRELYRVIDVFPVGELRKLIGIGVEGKIDRTALTHRAEEVVAGHFGDLRGEHRAQHSVAGNLAQLHYGLGKPGDIHHLDAAYLSDGRRIRKNGQGRYKRKQYLLHFLAPFSSLTAASTLAKSVASLFFGIVEKARRIRPESTIVPVEYPSIRRRRTASASTPTGFTHMK